LPTSSPPLLITNGVDANPSFWSYIDETSIDRFYDKYGAWPEFAKANIDLFYRMLAKIAHAWVSVTEGIGTFKPLLLDIIFGRAPHDRYMFNLIGCEPHIPEAVLGQSHSLRTDYYRIRGTEYVGANVRLFDHYGAPEYIVIVGERLLK
jgi:hypothetical protein